MKSYRQHLYAERDNETDLISCFEFGAENDKQAIIKASISAYEDQVAQQFFANNHKIRLVVTSIDEVYYRRVFDCDDVRFRMED